jgi:hypothetical protein
MCQSYLEVGAHIFDHQPEDFAANIEYSVHRAGTVAGYTQTKIELDSLKKTRRLAAF